MYLWAALALGHLAVTLFWPSYFRVVPGRLEVLDYSPMPGRPVRRRSYDLRNAPLLVDLRAGYVEIDQPGAKPVSFHTNYIPGKNRLMFTLLLAALSTHAPGPLPDDELLG